MSNAFYNARGFNDKLTNWNTSKVTDMTNMFRNATNFNQPLPANFNTSNVLNMSAMFSGATNFNQPLTDNFNTSKVLNMSAMFSGASNFNQPLVAKLVLNTQTYSGFDTSQVTNMSYMFNDATEFNQSLTTFDTSNVTNMSYMFATNAVEGRPDYNSVFSLLGMQFNQPLINFNMSNVIGNTDMFYGAIQFTFQKPEIPVKKEERGKAMISKYIMSEKHSKNHLFAIMKKATDRNTIDRNTIDQKDNILQSMDKQFTVSMNFSINSI